MNRKILMCLILFAGLFSQYAESAEKEQLPAVKIQKPQNGASFASDDTISFAGVATDLDDGDIPDKSMVWTSDIDNLIGTGKLVMSKLSDGTHLITLRATNSKGAIGKASILIVVKPGEKKEPKPIIEKAEPPAKKANKPDEKVKPRGMCYSPFRDNQDPDKGVYSSIKEMESDIGFIAKLTPLIRTYGCTNGLEKIPALCEKNNIDCYAGAWLGKYKTENQKEVDALVQVSNQGLEHLKGLIVGNEVLLAKSMTEDELINFIRQVKKTAKVPVTTAEIWSVWLEHPKLVNEVDFLLVHIHPYWEGIPVEKSAEHVLAVLKHMQEKFPGKRIVIGETGWPSDGSRVGEAIPSQENQARFLSDFLRLAADKEYFYFEIFDEKWKGKFEGNAGANWGIFNSDGSLKKQNTVLPAVECIKRPPGASASSEDSAK